MATWLTFPSKKPAFEAEKCLTIWRERGYKLAIWRDTGDEPVNADLLLRGVYPGYYAAVNRLCKAILEVDSGARWIVAAGDDMLPDPHSPEQIAEECTEHFGGTFGVMQPTGDRWGDPGHVYSEHICGSPWLGREFCRRMYGGRGPYSEEYWHMHGDECLMNVAVKLGVLWQRPDLIHYHAHWARENKPMPIYLQKANAEFYASKEIFERQKAAGFPGHEPIPMTPIIAVHIEITTACNRQCVNCMAGMGKRPAVHHSWEYFEEAARWVQGIEEVWLTGGEPTLHPQFAEFVPKFKELFKCKRLVLVTNGYGVLKHKDVLHHFDRIQATPYGDDNAVEIAFLKSAYGAILYDGVHIPVSRRGSGAACFRASLGMCLYADGRFCPCCSAGPFVGGPSVVPCVDWREKLQALELPCKECWFSP